MDVIGGEAPTLECDLVMKGGITSGVVYPKAVAELARSYRFCSVGGTSAGAIAAAVTAAGEYGRRTGPDPFPGLIDGLPEQLGNPAPDGKPTLFHLFKPQANLSAIYRLLFTLIGREPWWRRLLIGLGALPLFALLGAVPGLAVMLMAHGPAWWLQLLIGLVFAVFGALAAVAGGALVLAFRRIPDNAYGICSGMGGADDSGVAALTPWLHALIQKAANLPEDRPLTFGDLWANSGSETAPRQTELVLMTSNVTQGISHRFPFIERSSLQPLFFKTEEFEKLFPAAVVQHLVRHARVLSNDSKSGSLPEGFHRLPAPADLPVLMGARMSLSFPVLLSAVPLHTISYEQSGADRLQRVWFSDGGLTSNFPIHFFDGPLPTRPTFCINLAPAGARITEKDVLVEATEQRHDDAAGMVWMPSNNSGGMTARFASVDERGFGRLPAMLGAMFDTSQSWQDNELMLMPGYRDRIAHVLLRPEEGGLNLDMPKEVIAGVGQRGRAAARELAKRFAPDASLDPATGKKIVLGWDNHRWIRYRTMMAGFEDVLRRMHRVWSTPMPAPQRSYDAVLADSGTNGGSYPWLTKAQRQHAIDCTRTLIDLAASWDQRAETFDRPAVSDRGGSPRPKARLRLMPSETAIRAPSAFATRIKRPCRRPAPERCRCSLLASTARVEARQWGSGMPYSIRPEDRIHIGDFRDRPFARHSPDLQRILNTLRADPLAGRYVLVCTKPFREWRLARHPGERGKPIEILDHPPFHSRAEAEWAVFRLRWKEKTGEDLN